MLIIFPPLFYLPDVQFSFISLSSVGNKNVTVGLFVVTVCIGVWTLV